MMKKSIWLLALWLGCGASLKAAQITVFAAASLTDALKQIAGDYQAETGDSVVLNLAASGTLARQIEAGAPADLFISADEARVDALAAKGLLVNESRRNLLGNTLVLITPADRTSIQSPVDLTNAAVEHVAVGNVKTVPCGTYARAYLERAGWWRAIEPKVVPGENARAVLAVVASGDAEAGFVYKTDAASSRQVRVAYDVPAAEGPKIIYPAALVRGGEQPAAAAKFLAYLSADKAAKVFRQAGFTVLGVAADK